MRAILSLFYQSPFAPLRKHMDEVGYCMEKIREIIESYKAGDQEAVEGLAKIISKLEHNADLTKNDIRNNLPKSLFLPIDRGNLLEILSIQDCLADKAEDIGVLLTLKPYQKVEGFEEEFSALLDKNMEAFHKVRLIIEEMHELLQSSFGGSEAEKVKTMVEEVAYFEHEADLIQRRVIKILYNSEDQIPYTTFSLLMHIVGEVGAIADLSEKLANRVRMTLELK
ncbi:MAG: putative phosphate transport protein (TIGR00153 family) [Chlamydiales bacterium]|jgi:predicted phosphate transport protein (TIGR00153 family)